MARPRNSIPSYRRRKDGRAFCIIDGRHVYLGTADTPESRREYDRVVAEWLANGRSLPRSQSDLTVDEIALRFTRWILRTHDKESSVVARYRYALRPVHRLFGSSLGCEFSPRRLLAVREEMIRRGLGLTTVNGYISAIKSMFAWAVQEEFVPAEVDWGLRAVKGLRRGQRADVKNPKSVGPVPEADLKATLAELTPTVRAMVRLQLETGMRPGELVQMTTGDIERDAEVWVYRPKKHKTARFGVEREVFLGPDAQQIVGSFLRPGTPNEPIFSPMRSLQEFQTTARKQRVTPLYPSHVRRLETKRKTEGSRKRPPGDQYTVATYRRAIERACRRAGVPAWTPHQLRHSAGKAFRARHGIETARALLGHRNVGVTERYAELDLSMAQRALSGQGG